MTASFVFTLNAELGAVCRMPWSKQSHPNSNRPCLYKPDVMHMAGCSLWLLDLHNYKYNNTQHTLDHPRYRRKVLPLCESGYEENERKGISRESVQWPD